MTSQSQIMPVRVAYHPAYWMRLLTGMPFPLSTCKQRSSMTILSFFLVIALEIAKMNTSLCVSLDTAFANILPFIREYPSISRLNDYFVPQMDNMALFITARSQIGLLLIIFCLIFLSIAVIQRYVYKPISHGILDSALYHTIRHPRSSALALCGFGMLLIWPRYIVLAMYIAMLFGCYFLARVRDHELTMLWRTPYSEYRKRTHMFLPFGIPYINRLPSLPRSGIKRLLAIFGIYFLTVLTVFTLIG